MSGGVYYWMGGRVPGCSRTAVAPVAVMALHYCLALDRIAVHIEAPSCVTTYQMGSEAACCPDLLSVEEARVAEAE